MFGKKWYAVGTIALMLVGLMAFSSMGYNAPSDASVGDYQRTVSVTGDAKVSIEPDLARLSVAVETREVSAVKAAAQNAKLMNSVIDALKEAGVNEKDIKTAGYSLETLTEWEQDTRNYKVIGYRVVNNINFSTKALDRVGEFLDIAITAGANRANAPVFTVVDRDELQLELLKAAMLNAQSKAEALVTSVNASLGPVVTISEQSIGGIWERHMAMPEMMDDGVAYATTPILPDDVELTAKVHVVFSIK